MNLPSLILTVFVSFCFSGLRVFLAYSFQRVSFSNPFTAFILYYQRTLGFGIEVSYLDPRTSCKKCNGNKIQISIGDDLLSRSELG